MACAKSPPELGFSRRTSLPHGYGGVWGAMRDMATLAGGLQADNPKKENVELALAAVAGVTALDVACGASLARHARPKPRRRLTAIDYSRRSGFRKPAEQMRGAARDFYALEEKSKLNAPR